MKSFNENIDNLVCIECNSSTKSIFKVYQDGFKDINQCVKTRL